MAPFTPSDGDDDLGDSASAYDEQDEIDIDSLPPERRAEIEFVLAAGAGDEAAVATGLEDGIAVDAQDVDGSTALMSAAFQGHAAIATTLLDAGANVNAVQEKFSWTPLIAAAYGGHVAVARALLVAGANAEIVDGDGKTALDWAVAQRHVEAGELLHSAGAPLARMVFDDIYQPLPVEEEGPEPEPEPGHTAATTVPQPVDEPPVTSAARAASGVLSDGGSAAAAASEPTTATAAAAAVGGASAAGVARRDSRAHVGGGSAEGRVHTPAPATAFPDAAAASHEQAAAAAAQPPLPPAAPAPAARTRLASLGGSITDLLFPSSSSSSSSSSRRLSLGAAAAGPATSSDPLATATAAAKAAAAAAPVGGARRDSVSSLASLGGLLGRFTRAPSTATPPAQPPAAAVATVPSAEAAAAAASSTGAGTGLHASGGAAGGITGSRRGSLPVQQQQQPALSPTEAAGGLRGLRGPSTSGAAGSGGPSADGHASPALAAPSTTGSSGGKGGGAVQQRPLFAGVAPGGASAQAPVTWASLLTPGWNSEPWTLVFAIYAVAQLAGLWGRGWGTSYAADALF